MTATRPSTYTVELVIKRDDGRCALCGAYVLDGARGFAWSVHHRRPAGMGGDRKPETHSPANLVLLCGSGTTGCHGEVESRRAEALTRGLLIPKWTVEQPPARWAIEHAVHGWTYLWDDGTASDNPPEVAA